MKRTLYRFQSRAGLSSAFTPADASSEDSGSGQSSQFVTPQRKGHTVKTQFNRAMRALGGYALRTPIEYRDANDELAGKAILVLAAVVAETIAVTTAIIFWA